MDEIHDEQLGSSSVSSSVRYDILGTDIGSKLKKARVIYNIIYCILYYILATAVILKNL